MSIGSAVAQNEASNPNLSSQQAQSLGVTGNLLGVLAAQQAQKEAAEIGKTNVNVNVNNANQPTLGNSATGFANAQTNAPQVNINNANQPTASDSSIQYVTDQKMTNGSTYTGPLKLMSDGLLHPYGRGEQTWPDGTQYQGDFKDCHNGHGVMTWPTGQRYEGDWKDDKRNGHGVHTWPGGQRYEGEWKDELQNGYGVFTLPNGQRAGGEWKDGKFVGSQSQASAGDNQKSQVGSSKFGFVNITADDPAFEVFADGAFVGNSPAKLKLSEGPHTIEVRKKGFKDYKKEIRVTDGSELNLRAVLEKQ